MELNRISDSRLDKMRSETVRRITWLGTALLFTGFLSSILTSGGLFGSDYCRATVVRVIPSEQTGSLPHCVVARSDAGQVEAIVRRGDMTQYRNGDRVTLCQPFGPPYVIHGVKGVAYLGMSKASLPALVLGLALLISGPAIMIVKKKDHNTSAGIRKSADGLQKPSM